MPIPKTLKDVGRSLLRQLGAAGVSENLIRRVGHLVFLVAAGAFAFVFWKFAHREPSKPLGLSQLLEICRYFGVAVTFWASLVAAFDFSIQQARFARPWLSGLNLVMLGGTVSFCLLAMYQNDRPVLYTVAVHLALGLYLLWDLIARNYYKRRSTEWLRYYDNLLFADITFFTWYTLGGYLPFVFQWIASAETQIDLSEVDSLSDGFTAAALILQFLFYWSYSALYGRRLRREGEEVLGIEEGYQRWSEVFDRGNAVMHVERRHTLRRLAELEVGGRVADLGCGTGFYSARLAEKADHVIALDQSMAMLGRLSERLGTRDNVKAVRALATNLHMIDDASLNGVVCCLVIDHLRDLELRACFAELGRVLRPGGWLYLTDVNPYFELLQEPYAKFLDLTGRIRKVRVYPHTMGVVLEELDRSGLQLQHIQEERILPEDVTEWPDLGDYLEFPLIVEYYALKGMAFPSGRRALGLEPPTAGAS